MAERDGGQLVVEPVNHLQVGFNHTVGEVRALIRTIDSPAIRPMVDTIHMNIEEQSLLEPIRPCGDELAHVHLRVERWHFREWPCRLQAVLDTLRSIGYLGYATVKVYRPRDPAPAACKSLQYLHDLASH